MSQQKFNADDPRLSAYLMDELEPVEREEIEGLLREDPEAREFVEELKRTAGILEEEFRVEGAPGLSVAQRTAVEKKIVGGRRRWIVQGAAAAVLLLAVGATLMVKYGAEENAPYAYRFFGSVDRPVADNAAPRKSPPLNVYANTISNNLEQLSELGYDGIVAEVEAELVSETEDYAHVEENPWKFTGQELLSTFSIDVDTASYSNMRRILREGRLPPADAVRIEEFINYFRYDDPAPEGGEPFRVTTEVASAPWKPQHRLLRIGIQAREIEWSQRTPTNLVFLLDVSGSMNSPDKLPLLQRSLRLLVEQLDERDRVAIVVYAGASGQVLPSTSCQYSAEILAAVDRLSAGGSTNGGAGIELAYKLAEENFLTGGLNRVILATDGDFNVGLTDQDALVELIEAKRESGVFLSVLGFGTGNLKDSTMELLADKGNGNFAYIDSLAEARKVLVSEMGGTLIPVAKDVKIQVAFNPAKVKAWRLIGYENRVLDHQDFADDTKDAGEIGAGHSVTALYEIVPPLAPFEEQKLQHALREKPTGSSPAPNFDDELALLKLRFKQPDSDTSSLITSPVEDQGHLWHHASNNLRFAAAVAAYATLLKESSSLPEDFNLQRVYELAYEARGQDPGGYREEFLRLIKLAQKIVAGESLEGLKELGYK